MANASEWGSKGLPFMAIGRVKGAVRLAYYINKETAADSQQATMDVFTKLLAAAASKLTAGQRTRLQWNDGSVCCLMDPKGELLYCVVTSLLTYPERLAYQLLYDMQALTNQQADIETAPEDELMQTLEPKMKELVKYYEDSSNFPQFALGMSRDSLTSAQSAQSVGGVGAPDNSRRNKIIIAILFLVIVAVVVGIVLSQSSSSTLAVADVAADANRGGDDGVKAKVCDWGYECGASAACYHPVNKYQIGTDDSCPDQSCFCVSTGKVSSTSLLSAGVLDLSTHVKHVAGALGWSNITMLI